MKSFESITEWQDFRKNLHTETIGFVPTMGALHAGHKSLVLRSKAENTVTVASIFVNPAQFNNKDDLAHYPRTLKADLALLQDAGVDYVLLPTQAALYPDSYRYRVSENALSTQLCGAHRPGHFDGVLSVVLKLLQLVRPNRAYFGEKDYQQFLLIRDMVSAFFLDAEIIPCPTLREADGLAYSSRNMRLSEAARAKAPLLYRALRENNPALLEGFTVDYFEEQNGRRYAAASIEGVRLIDNVAV